MDSDNALVSLFLHLFFVFIFIGGITVATVLRFTVALNVYKKSSEIATILAIVRPLVAVVVSSLIILIAFGFWAAHEHEKDLRSAWLAVTYAFVAWMFVVGAVAGRHDRITRQMAVAEGAENPMAAISKGLSLRLKSPLPLLLNISMISAVFIVLGMMVFQPGQDSDET